MSAGRSRGPHWRRVWKIPLPPEPPSLPTGVIELTPASAAATATTTLALTAPPTPGYLRGVNAWTFGYASSDPTYRGEPASSYTFLAGRGIKIVRLAFYWGMLQPTLGGALSTTYVAGLQAEIDRIAAAGMNVVLELHNSCRHPMPTSTAIYGNGITTVQAADVWKKLSDLFKNNPWVVAYDLMNEPYTMPNATWQSYSQVLVNTIRNNGDSKTLWVEGNGWSAPERFATNHPTAWITDPLNKTVYSAHQYFDYSGTYAKGFDYNSYATEMASVLPRLASFTNWLTNNNVEGSIGEVGWPNSERTSTWAQWNAKGEAWYDAADAAGLPVTYFSATSAYNEKNVAYDAPTNAWQPIAGISVAETQATVIEAHPSQ